MINKIYEKLLWHFSAFGTFLFYFIVLAYFLINNLILFNQLLVSMLLIIFIGYPLRIIFFRERPKKEKYSNLFEKFEASSFPSGHSARITSLLIILSQGKNIYTIILFSIITITVYWSRIILKKHYYIDVIGGIILGIISALLTFKIL